MTDVPDPAEARAPQRQSSMDIAAKPGTLVRFANPTWGYQHDQEQAAKYLCLRACYTVAEIEIGSSSTHIRLVEVPGVWFNSVLFSDEPAVPSVPAPALTPLFRLGRFALHSGGFSDWKIECDALSDADWTGLALILSKRLPSFGRVEGVPSGGLKLAEALRPFAERDNPRLLIVDDVLTTGRSMEAQRAGRHAYGAVVFARGGCGTPPWVTALFVETTRSAGGDSFSPAVSRVVPSGADSGHAQPAVPSVPAPAREEAGALIQSWIDEDAALFRALGVLIATWRLRGERYGAEIVRCANELEAALAAVAPGQETQG